MSWHTSGVLINADHSENPGGVLPALGVENAEQLDETIDFDEANSGSMENVAIACVDGWTCLFGFSAMLIFDEERLAEIAKTADIFIFHLEGTCGLANFEWWTKGKKAREWMAMEGEVSKDSGKPSPAEKAVFQKTDDDEQRVLMLMEQLTVPVKRLAKLEYAVFSWDD